MKKFSLLLFFLYSCSLFSQELESDTEALELRGRIIFSSMNQSPINILNLTQETGTTNNEEGDFEIKVSLGDELLFSSVQYMPYKITIDEKILETEKLIVELVPSVTKLEQVRISNIDLLGYLLADVNSFEGEIVYDNQTLGFPPPSPATSIERRRMYAATSGVLGGLVNLISGRLKYLKKLEEFAQLKALVEKASRSMDEDFFVKECKIPPELIISFMYFCAEHDYFRSLVYKDQKLDLIRFFMQRAEEYRRMRGLES